MNKNVLLAIGAMLMGIALGLAIALVIDINEPRISVKDTVKYFGARVGDWSTSTPIVGARVGEWPTPFHIEIDDTNDIMQTYIPEVFPNADYK